MAFSVINHTAKGSSDATGVTTDGITTTGADLIVVGLSAFGISTETLTDNKSNTWTKLTKSNGGSHNPDVLMFYAWAPTVGSGHTFAVSGSSAPSLVVLAVSGALASDPLESQNGGTSGGNTVQPGSCTTTGSNLFVTVLGSAGALASTSIDSSFTLLDSVNFAGGQHYAAFVAWREVGTAQNPTWTATVVTENTAAIASFKPAAVVSGQPAMRRFGRAPLGVDGVRIY